MSQDRKEKAQTEFWETLAALVKEVLDLVREERQLREAKRR